MRENFVDCVVESACQAGSILLKYREKGFSVASKGGMEFVTEADFKSENFLEETLTSLLPGSSFLGEESWGGNWPEAPFWVVDPLDGTNNYAVEVPFFCVSIALVDEDGVSLGCIHDPVHSETFLAMRGGGAFLNGTDIKVSSAVKLRDAVFATGFPYSRTSENLNFDMDVLTGMLGEARGIRRCGSAALDLAYTATGRYGGFWEENLKPWDMAAGVLLVQEAGGIVSGFRENSWTLQSRGVQCSAPGLWNQFCSIIKKRPR
ncbi:inositol monophosphatase [Candidatus Fermentibacteria bacterium]|nr:MAG: inositol monophosphatase [Candidatus Fermentibacteria bacterium]